MEFNVKVLQGQEKELWLAFWCEGTRIGSVVLDEEQAGTMLEMLEWHLGTDAPGNFIHDEMNGMYFLSEGKGDLFAIGRPGVEITVPYKDCRVLRARMRHAHQELVQGRSIPLKIAKKRT